MHYLFQKTSCATKRTSDDASPAARRRRVDVPRPLPHRMARWRVAVIGHSYIRRLSQYMNDTPGCTNLGFSSEEALVRCFHQGGATLRLVPDHHWINIQLQPALLFHLSVVYIHVGENDIGSLTGEEMASHMAALVTSIIAGCHPSVVIVSQLLWFPRYEQLPDSVVTFNNRMQQTSQRMNETPDVVEGHAATRVVYWRHQFGVWGAGGSGLYLSDGVHLNSTGLRRYYFSVRQVVGSQLRALEQSGSKNGK